MSRRKRDLSAEERSLWRRATESVKPRRSQKAKADSEPEARPASRPRILTSEPERAGRSASSAPPPADRGAEKRVRRGKLEPSAALDLHGHTQANGRVALARFLRAAHARGDRTVIVVTGVGRAGQGVLRRHLPEWLNDQTLRPLIAGFAQAHRSHGGAGAYYVFLKRSTD